MDIGEFFLENKKKRWKGEKKGEEKWEKRREKMWRKRSGRKREEKNRKGIGKKWARIETQLLLDNYMYHRSKKNVSSISVNW